MNSRAETIACGSCCHSLDGDTANVLYFLNKYPLACYVMPITQIHQCMLTDQYARSVTGPQTGDDFRRIATTRHRLSVRDMSITNVCGVVIFRARNILTLLSPVYLCCLRIAATFQEPSPLLATSYGSRARFSKDQGKLTGSVSYFEINVSRKVGCVLASNEVHFVSLAENFTV